MQRKAMFVCLLIAVFSFEFAQSIRISPEYLIEFERFPEPARRHKLYEPVIDPFKLVEVISPASQYGHGGLASPSKAVEFRVVADGELVD